MKDRSTTCPDLTRSTQYRDRAHPDQGHAPGDHVLHAETQLGGVESRAAAIPDWLVEAWIGSYLMLDTGEGSVTSHTIEHLTGRCPMTLRSKKAAEPSSLAHLAQLSIGPRLLSTQGSMRA